MIQGADTLSWHNYGAFPVVEEIGTTVTVNGVAQSTWDATGVNVTNDKSYDLVAILKANNKGLAGYGAINANAPQAYTFPSRTSTGAIHGNTSDSDADTVLVNKAYLRANVPSSENNNPYPLVLTLGANNEGWRKTPLTENAGNYSIPRYSSTGTLNSKSSTIRRSSGDRSVTAVSPVVTKNW